MSFSLIFTDELKGFYKSKVMIFLWIGLPALAVLVHLSLPSEAGFSSASVLTALILTSIAGLLSSVMLAVNIINEKDTRVYDLFLIRPIKRWYLLVSKFFAVYLCVSVACIIAILIGITIDYFQAPMFFDLILQNIIDPFVMIFAIIAISSAFGILIGVISPSIVVGVILVIFVGNYVSFIPNIPIFLEMGNTALMVLLVGIIASIIFMLLSILIFNRKQF